MTRDEKNAAKLRELHPSIRAKVAAVIRDLEGHGHCPVIAEAWRDPARQRQLYRAGRSKVTWGMHCAMSNGKPAALAADIVCATRGWSASRTFWLMLGASSTAHAMRWGGLWGLPKRMRQALIDSFREHDWDHRIHLGWDCAHIETSRVTVAQARRGER